MKHWTVYILKCSNDSLYTGVTTNIDRRIEEHNSGKGAKYMRAHGPGTLIWSKGEYSESEAKVEEARIKKLSRVQKINFISIN